jgi:hypothetical protein
MQNLEDPYLTALLRFIFVSVVSISKNCFFFDQMVFNNKMKENQHLSFSLLFINVQLKEGGSSCINGGRSCDG